MWILNIFLFLVILALGLLFIIGMILFIIGKFKKNDDNRTSKIGLRIILIPIIIFTSIVVYGLIREVFTSKPDKKDLVGKYKMSNSSFIDIGGKKYNLEFFENGNFTITKTPNIDLCESGEYDVDYQFVDNEVSFKCGNGYSTARIDREFGNYKIEFIIGDPDSGESIYFEKVEK